MKTIDRLILDILASQATVTARDLSATLGEDGMRCYEWLERFRKKGLCDEIVMRRSRHIHSLVYRTYAGHAAKITEYLGSLKLQEV